MSRLRNLLATPLVVGILLVLAGIGTYLVTPLLIAHAPTPPLERCGLVARGADGMANAHRCLEAGAYDLIASDGVGAVARVQEVAETNQVLADACHQAMHKPGRRVGRQLDDPAEVRATMAKAPSGS